MFKFGIGYKKCVFWIFDSVADLIYFSSKFWSEHRSCVKNISSSGFRHQTEKCVQTSVCVLLRLCLFGYYSGIIKVSDFAIFRVSESIIFLDDFEFIILWKFTSLMSMCNLLQPVTHCVCLFVPLHLRSFVVHRKCVRVVSHWHVSQSRLFWFLLCGSYCPFCWIKWNYEYLV